MSISVNSADAFDAWQNSKDNYEKVENGKKDEIETFQLFDYNAQAENVEKAYADSMRTFSQQYIDKYDKDDNGKMDFDEFVNMQEAAYEQLFGEKIDTTIPGVTDQLKDAFGQLSNINGEEGEDQFIDAEEYGAFLSVVDAMDEGKMDGNINYFLFNAIPGLKSFPDAVKRFYNDVFNK